MAASSAVASLAVNLRAIVRSGATNRKRQSVMKSSPAPEKRQPEAGMRRQPLAATLFPQPGPIPSRETPDRRFPTGASRPSLDVLYGFTALSKSVAPTKAFQALFPILSNRKFWHHPGKAPNRSQESPLSSLLADKLFPQPSKNTFWMRFFTFLEFAIVSSGKADKLPPPFLCTGPLLQGAFRWKRVQPVTSRAGVFL